MRFAELTMHKRLKEAMAHLDYTEMTEVQAQTIPYALIGRDLAVASKTGSGKTLAYLIPLMHRLLTSRALSTRGPRALILAPTRELAKQVYAQLRFLVAGTPLHCSLVLGGENFNEQIKSLRKTPEILVATPGRLLNHLKARSFLFDGVEMLVLDEADRMLDLGFADALKAIHAAASHRLRQTWLFSATLNHQSVEMLSGYILKAPQTISIGEMHAVHADINEVFHLCDHLDHKQALLNHLLLQPDYQQAIVFLATREDTDRLAKQYSELKIPALALSGDMKQAQRNQVIDQFSRGHAKVLFTTDVAARGLDLSHVSLVINFDMPKLPEEYIHRIGRTGRAGNQGNAVSLISPKDWSSFQGLLALQRREVTFTTISGLEGKFKGVLAPKKTRFSDKDTHPLAEAKAAAAKGKRPLSKTTAKGPVRKESKNRPARHATQNVSDMDGFAPVRKKAPSDVAYVERDTDNEVE